MCDHHRLRSQPTLGEVDHVVNLSENIGALYMRESYCDITLLVENARFPAHKVILAARSEYFRALFFGGMRESRPGCDEIEMKDTSASAFQQLLQYIYTGRMHLANLKEELLLEILGLAHQYGFQELQTAISTYLQDILNIRNVCLIYDIASMFSLDALAQTCCEFMDCNAADVLLSEAFLTLSSSALQEVLSRDSFCAPEVDIFQAVRRWSEHNTETTAAEVMKVVRLPLMNLEDLLNIVRMSNLVSADVILDAIKLKNESRDMELEYRGFLRLEENIGTLRHGAQVIKGEMKAALLDGDHQNYDLDRGFTRHPIDDTQGQGIVIKLAQPSIINTIVMLLWDRDQRSYSYQLEVSMDDKDWVRVVDHTHYLCRSWQYLRFPRRVVRYIRVMGTHNTVNRVFHLVSIECLFSKKPCELHDGIIVPKENIATIEASACVIEGVSRSRNALINGDTKNYDWDSGYTCHQLGSGAIVVQLAQPYMIGSMRLLLWDCDGRSYSYYVEVSTDQTNWQTVADKTTEACRSWQVIVFEQRPVTFVKIVGTHNTANEVFHCVHFECPADPLALVDQNYNKGPKPSQRTTSTSGGTSSSSAMSTDAAPSLMTNNIPTQPVVAMARVSPMPSNIINVVMAAGAAPDLLAISAGPNAALDLGNHGNQARVGGMVVAQQLPNRPAGHPEESDENNDGGSPDVARFRGLGVAGAVGGRESPMDDGSDREAPQGMRIVWIDRGDGLGMENEEVRASTSENNSSPARGRRESSWDEAQASGGSPRKDEFDKNGNRPPPGPFS